MAKMAEAEVVDYVNLSTQLEQQELEAPGGVATPQLYGQLLAIYLLHNDLPNAKFLWKRIPQNVKTANAELAHVWNVGQKMWQRDFSAIYEALNHEWSDSVKPIMEAIKEAMQKRAFQLVSKAYSSISSEDFSSFVGMSPSEATEAAVKQGWTVDAQSNMLTPCSLEKPTDPVIPSEQQLSRLTDFVAFLEN